MSWIPFALQAAGTLMSISGARSGARASRASARARQKAKEFEAAQLEQNAGQAIAASQRVAAERRRQAMLVQSRALAVAAAGGGGVGENDTSFLNLMAKTAGRGEYDAAVALYEGEDKARLLRMQAAARRYEGEVDIDAGESAASAYKTQGLSSALTSGGTMLAKYGGGGPKGDSNLLLPEVNDWRFG